MSVQLKEKYVKSPLNYVGGKHKLLPQILPLFPEKIGTFIDVFAGGCNVAANVDAEVTIINDKQAQVVDLIEYIYSRSIDELLRELDAIIESYQLSKTNKEGYLKLRADYNTGNVSPQMFYALVTHSFNNQIRFNQSGGFNMPFGKDRSSFNPMLRERFIRFKETLDEKSLSLRIGDFRDLELDSYGNDRFVYCDPPYLITTAAYNESGGWSEQDERDLYEWLDSINESGIKFALSNVIEHKGRTNDILTEWSRKYSTHNLSISYANSNYRSSNRDSVTREVLITNY
ncbi:DNA adenine methylase [Alkalihalobacillus clausii]|uniref:DNA adenine methylase n=1 Tax=Shouchella clausii TaxID=79880 RepID=UPI001C22F67F|nr:DNA adenine methylase [Shouchella clausii]MBU8597340.1 DNA adenine methylase [Shouchella clausii]